MASKGKATFTIGRLANAAGLSITTIRYYQKRGLLQVPERPKLGGFRSYDESDIAQLQLIRRAQELGFTLAEILELSSHLRNGHCTAIRTLAINRIKAITAQVQLLENIRKELVNLVSDCPTDCLEACLLVRKLTDSSAPQAAPKRRRNNAGRT